MFTKEELDEIKKALNIVEFIGRYVNLHKAGSSFRGLCPFHNDNDPSFYVHPHRGFYHCFGCGEKGDIITFYQKIESISFSEAVKRLADIAGVSVELSASESEYDRYTSIIAKLARIYSENLAGEPNNPAELYLKKRKLSRHTFEEFLVGYSSDSRTFVNSLTSKLRTQESEMVQLGILYRKGNTLRDRFEGRLTIPIDNESGRIVGFGGRQLIQEGGPKYINSPETKYFQKSRLLYNLSRAKGVIKELNYAVIVEGYFDVMALYEAGVSNVVGLLGTALTDRHLRILGNFTKNLLFFLDSDSAGQMATLRSIDVAERLDFATAVALVRGAKDPADLFSLKGSQGVQDALTSSMPGPVFRVELLSRDLDLSIPQGKKRLIESVRPYIESFRSSGNLSTVQLTIRSLSEKTGYSEDELAPLMRNRTDAHEEARANTTVTLKMKDLLRVYLQYPSLRSRVSRQLELMEPGKEMRELLRGMKKGLELEDLLDLVNEEFGREIIELASSCIDEDLAAKIIDTTNDYTNKRLVEEQIAEIDRKLSTLEDKEAKTALLIRRMELRRLLVRKRKGGD